jgi:hypothetical protein
MIKYQGQLKDIDLDIETHKSHHKNKNGGYNVTRYCNSIFTFDIEVTSAWLENGKVIPYRKGESAEYWNGLQALSLPYIWQFSCDGVVYYGREFREFKQVLNDLPKDCEIIIWVHNLSYEFMFLSNILTWASVFARNPHKPIKCSSKEYPNITFRCSYFLTRLSLDNWGKQIGLPKKTGDLDYEQIRTPYTPLTETELGYCERDCLVVEAGIKNYLKKYGKQRFIPLTQTGTVRREVKDMLTSNPDYVSFIKKLIPADANQYKILQDVFAGGYTHANRMYAGKTISEYIEHYDFTSSYPTVMIAEKYPMTPWTYRGKEMPQEKNFDKFAYLFRVKFRHLKCTHCNTYIQSAKSECVKPTFDNGRVITADELSITLTEQDWLTIKETYEWESVEVLFCYRSYKRYLPREFCDYILDLYANKTKLKDVEGYEDLYLQSKQYINSMFGMCVTAIIQANIILDNGEWYIEPLTTEVVNKKLNKLRNSNPREKRYFLSYSWGCWVTAYARRNLWKCIESCDYDVLYCDTDSIFVRGKKDFSWYNEEITYKLEQACLENDLDVEKTRPCTPDGEEKPLGLFEQEKPCCQFRTLGAKRYVERREKDNKLYMTVSGIDKSAVELLNDDIDNFDDGFNFDKDADCITKKLCTYLNDIPICTYPDGYISTYKYGINLRRNGYLLSMTDEYTTLLKMCNFNLGDISQGGMNKIRAYFYAESEE